MFVSRAFLQNTQLLSLWESWSKDISLFLKAAVYNSISLTRSCRGGSSFKQATPHDQQDSFRANGLQSMDDSNGMDVFPTGSSAEDDAGIGGLCRRCGCCGVTHRVHCDCSSSCLATVNWGYLDHMGLLGSMVIFKSNT